MTHQPDDRHHAAPQGVASGSPELHAGPDGPGRGWSVRLRYDDGAVGSDPELAALVESFLEAQLARLRARAGQVLHAAPHPDRPVRWEIL